MLLPLLGSLLALCAAVALPLGDVTTPHPLSSRGIRRALAKAAQAVIAFKHEHDALLAKGDALEAEKVKERSQSRAPLAAPAAPQPGPAPGWRARIRSALPPNGARIVKEFLALAQFRFIIPATLISVRVGRWGLYACACVLASVGSNFCEPSWHRALGGVCGGSVAAALPLYV